MRFYSKKNISSVVFYVYFSGVHNTECNKYRHELENNTVSNKNLKITRNEQSEKNENNNKPKNTENKVSIKGSRKISG
jgi:hypothetical protein